ncbi:Cell wall integrity and stress response component 1 [Paragonimus heterotremus]|uniref:Cell wall integrity and stress response component 1 n=1 Tax=Paragonimus heterotremus TaxID=100268 RepID=A0A8J4SSZ1_9TREM|nr:Cell wall integrity and stress response component 1 [Paragonimus heterotremus]
MSVEGNPKVSSSGPLLVIGAGFGRTGTKSLKTALEIIYGQPCYHMTELLTHHKDDSRKWIEVDRLVSESKDGKIDPRLFYEIFDGYRCTVDFPSCSYYPQLMQVYPQAKVVLTVRDKHSWLQSVRATILPRRDLRRSDWADRMMIAYLNGHDFLTMHFIMWERTLGQSVDTLDDEMVLTAYDRWIDRVKQIVPADRLLVFQVKDGWEPLCKFLNVPVPNQPFPNVNERAEFLKRIENFQRLTRLLRWSVRVVVGFTIAAVLYRLL